MTVMWKLVRIGCLAAAAALTACSDTRSSTPAAPPALSSSLAIIGTVTTTTAPQPQTTTEKMGQPFTLGEVSVTLLSVNDPFPPSAQVQPAAGNRLVSISYEFVSRSSVTKSTSDLPTVELRDTAGAGYQSEHGRLSIVGGARAPGELPAGTRMKTSALFEVPASATGLRAVFRPATGPDRQGAVVALG